MDGIKGKMQAAAMILFALMFATIVLIDVFGTTTMALNDDATVKPTVAGQFVESQPVQMDYTGIHTEALTEELQEVELPEEIKKQYIYYDVPLDDGFQEYIQDVCEQYGFDRYDVIVALIERESTFRETVISKTADYGYMQINECNHEWLSECLGIYDFLDGEQNVLAGVYMLSSLYDKYGDIGLVLMAYNCGEAGAKSLWEQGIFDTSYSRAILESAETLEVRG